MVDLGTLAFTTKNYDLAADIYEQQLRDFGPSVDTYLALADSLAKSGKLQKAIQNYMTANRVGNIPPERLNHLADSLVDLMHQNKAMKRTNQEEGAGTADKRVDYFACDICKAMWNDPVTVGCGHTFCRSCLNAFFEVFHIFRLSLEQTHSAHSHNHENLCDGSFGWK